MTRLLIIGDAGSNSGFERVVRGICEPLFESGKYELTVRGVDYTEESTVRKYPWTVKSWGGGPGDAMGVLNFDSWLEEDRPDVMLMVHDLWNLTGYLAKKPRELPVVGYFPIDCPNLKWIHALGLGALAEAASYTRFGAHESAAGVRRAIDVIWDGHQHIPEMHSDKLGWLTLPNGELEFSFRLDRLNRYQNPSNWNIIPHGHTPGVFEPRDKAKARELWGLPKDAFVVLNVNANQFRKRLDLTVRAFAYLYRRRPDAYLVFHCASGDLAGWDLQDLAHYYGVSGRVLCVHHQVRRLTDDQLCWLYNAADVQINTSGGEGWGLTTFEGAACGVPQLVPNWSATRELWAEHAKLLPVSDWRQEPKYLNTAHAIIDPVEAGRLLWEFAEDPDYRAKYAALALEQAAKQVTWSDVGAAFDTLLTRALSEPAPAGMSFDQVRENQEPGVRSELEGMVSFADR